MRIIPISPAEYVSFPWKNGGGVTTDIAAEYAGPANDWEAMRWRLGFTSISVPGPFSEMTGFDRHQAVVRGRGLRLRCADGSEIDERAPFSPVRFAGEAKIVSVLDDGPVDVVNLIVRRGFFGGRLAAIDGACPAALGEGTHFLYAPSGDIDAEIGSTAVRVPGGHALRIEGAARAVVHAGLGLVASVSPVPTGRLASRARTPPPA
ncbi:MAG: hypothetical protein GC202_03415 [Alphaproteobacteria bacterium]|nr:hypothetical protein [Alphaproteobacteria bacterium]